MNQLQHPIDVAVTDPGSRRGEYVQWRQRLADKQEEMRNFDEPDLGPALDPRWSPEVLFRGEAESTTSADAPPAVEPRAAVAPKRAPAASAAVAPKRAAAVGTDPATRAEVLDLVREAVEATPDVPRPRAEVKTLLRRFLTPAGSPSTAAGTEGRAERADGRTATRTAPLIEDRTVARHPDQPEVVATPTVVRSRHKATVGEQLRALNRQRVDGELSEEEFKRQKRDLFIRSSTAARPAK